MLEYALIMLKKLFKKDKNSNIIILGSGRSGTSILGELFGYLPAFNYLFEPLLEDIPNHPNDKRICIKVPKGGKSLTKGLACDMDELVNILGKNTKIIWIIRNPLDTICSLKPGIEDNWNHNPKPPNYKKIFNKPWHIKCAHHWNYINSVGFKSASIYGPILIVRYEDLIIESKETISQILAFISSKTSIEDLTLYMEKLQNNTSHSYHAKFQIHWFRNNHKTRINRYKENMTEKEISETYAIIKKTASNFGYSKPL